ncbi:MAG: mannose-1-phosphate guanylyltransferase [Crocinitomicaceae bacterium]|nr:mannose-1-phosphate guanylyltransferase [Crocinitomicaceae bacterium]
MNNKSIYAVIMAGGVGSRFWPLSTPERPKQFIDVLGIGKTLIQMTYERLLNIVPEQNIFILSNENYVDMIQSQLPNMQRDRILTEPIRKNTAPCIAYAAAKINLLDKDACMIVCPSDHLIMKEDEFKKTIETAVENAINNNKIVTLGIKPTRPDTGYGYIEFNKEKKAHVGEVTKVLQFREKPNLETAELFVRSGNFYWNSGIFVWKSTTVLEALKTYQKDLFDLFCADISFYNTSNEQTFINQSFQKCQDISIDYAVMEKANNVDVVLASFDWSDLGTWKSLYEHSTKDTFNNSIIGKNVHTFNVKNCFINVPDKKTVMIDGLKNYIVVESDNALMILKNENEQELKNYLKAIENKK